MCFSITMLNVNAVEVMGAERYVMLDLGQI
jgi:hypothetical protein